MYSFLIILLQANIIASSGSKVEILQPFCRRYASAIDYRVGEATSSCPNHLWSLVQCGSQNKYPVYDNERLDTETCFAHSQNVHGYETQSVAYCCLFNYPQYDQNQVNTTTYTSPSPAPISCPANSYLVGCGATTDETASASSTRGNIRGVYVGAELANSALMTATGWSDLTNQQCNIRLRDSSGLPVYPQANCLTFSQQLADKMSLECRTTRQLQTSPDSVKCESGYTMMGCGAFDSSAGNSPLRWWTIRSTGACDGIFGGGTRSYANPICCRIVRRLTEDPTNDPTRDPTNDPTTDPTSDPTVPPGQANAVMQANCKDYGTMFRSDDGGKTMTELVTESGWSNGAKTFRFNLRDVTTRTIIKVSCRSDSSTGGFLAEMDVDGQTVTTTNGNGIWRVYEPSLKKIGLDSVTYTQNDGSASSVSTTAYWIDIPAQSSLDFYFRFRRIFPRQSEYDGVDEDEEEEKELALFEEAIKRYEERESAQARVEAKTQGIVNQVMAVTAINVQQMCVVVAVLVIAAVLYSWCNRNKDDEYKVIVESANHV